MKKKGFKEIPVHVLVFAFWMLGSIGSVGAQKGTISTVAGDGFKGEYGYGRFSGDGGPATRASLNFPSGIFVDGSGNLYFVDIANQRIRKIDADSGVISTVAGNGISEFSGDGGPATRASLNFASGIFVDGSGNIYIADALNHRIRKVDAETGIITTVAGNGIKDFSGDGGPATLASVGFPLDVFIDGSGNLYIADGGNNRIRKVDASGIISTVAGNGEAGDDVPLGDGGPATRASLFYPGGIFVDGSDNFYIADGDNNRIRKVDASGIISTVAGNGEHEPAEHGGDAFSGDGGPATLASVGFPFDVFIDGSGNLYIAATSHRIRKVDTSGIISTVVGDGFKDEKGYGRFSGDGGPATLASLDYPGGIFVDGSGNLYIADEANHRIRRVEGIATPTTLEVGVFAPVAVTEGRVAKTPDFNGDGTVNFSDFIQFAQNFGKKQGDPDFNAKFDLDDSGSVDFGDFLQFAQNFGKSVGGGKPVGSIVQGVNSESAIDMIEF